MGQNLGHKFGTNRQTHTQTDTTRHRVALQLIMSQMKLTNDEISQKLKDLHSIKMIFSVNKNCMDTGQQEYKQNIQILRKVYI